MLSERQNNYTTYSKTEYDKIVKFCKETQLMDDESFNLYNKQLRQDNFTSQGYQWRKKFQLITIEDSSVLVYKTSTNTPLDQCQIIVNHEQMYDALLMIHVTDSGNVHHKGN